LIYKISSTYLGERFAHLQERKTEIYSMWYNVLMWYEGCCLIHVNQHPSYRIHSAKLPLSGPQSTTAAGHYITCCKSQSYAPEDGQKVVRNMLSWSWRSINLLL